MEKSDTILMSEELEAAERQRREDYNAGELIYARIELAWYDTQAATWLRHNRANEARIETLEHQVEMLARLAADDWAFTSPGHRSEAIEIRNDILFARCGLNERGERISQVRP